MFPVLFEKGLITVYTYGVMLAMGFSVALFLSCRHAEFYGFSKKYISDFVYGLVVSGLLGARVFYVFQEWDYFRIHLVEILYIHRGGLVFYGSFFSTLVFSYLFLFKKSSDGRALANFIIPYVPLGQFWGRCGCFFNGCCYGKFSGAFFHPVQLYEAFFCLVLSAILFYFRARDWQSKCSLVGFYFFAYGTIRFLLEFLRDDLVPHWHGLRISQWISLFVVACSIGYGILFIWKKKRSNTVLLLTV